MDKKLDEKIVFLVRGDLIRRYPGVVAHAVRQAQDGVDRNSIRSPRCRSWRRRGGHAEEDALPHPSAAEHPAGRLRSGGAEIIDDDDRWWFTLSENPSEPRFGLDESRDKPVPPGGPSRDDLIWDDFAVAKGGFLSAAPRPISAATSIPADVARWGTSSADVAYLLFQLPARAAFRATNMLTGSRQH